MKAFSIFMEFFTDISLIVQIQLVELFQQE